MMQLMIFPKHIFGEMKLTTQQLNKDSWFATGIVPMHHKSVHY